MYAPVRPGFGTAVFCEYCSLAERWWAAREPEHPVPDCPLWGTHGLPLLSGLQSPYCAMPETARLLPCSPGFSWERVNFHEKLVGWPNSQSNGMFYTTWCHAQYLSGELGRGEVFATLEQAEPWVVRMLYMLFLSVLLMVVFFSICYSVTLFIFQPMSFCCFPSGSSLHSTREGVREGLRGFLVLIEQHHTTCPSREPLWAWWASSMWMLLVPAPVKCAAEKTWKEDFSKENNTQKKGNYCINWKHFGAQSKGDIKGKYLVV